MKHIALIEKDLRELLIGKSARNRMIKWELQKAGYVLDDRFQKARTFVIIPQSQTNFNVKVFVKSSYYGTVLNVYAKLFPKEITNKLKEIK